jgi:predicted transcriptional regulator
MCYRALRIKHKGSVMPDSTFTFRVDEALKNAFTAAAKASDRNAAQVLREVMRDYVAEEAPPTAERLAWLSRKVEKARAQIAVGQFYTSEEVEARFAERRAELRARIALDKAA